MAHCSTQSTYITGSWKSPEPPPAKYNSILIAALTNNTIVRERVENDIFTALGSSVTATKSITEIPPSISGTDTSKTAILQTVRKKKIDAILTVSLLSQETESRYMPDRNPYSPLGYGYNQDFWGYYNYWNPQFNNQNYYSQEKVYYIESNLYDSKTEKLMWSAQSKTYSPDNLESFSREFAILIAKKMREDGFLK
jgi:hypothetical protein